jgi:hypothetical protein
MDQIGVRIRHSLGVSMSITCPTTMSVRGTLIHPFVQNLYLDTNQLLTGKIPSEFAGIANLTDVDLYNN